MSLAIDNVKSTTASTTASAMMLVLKAFFYSYSFPMLDEKRMIQIKQKSHTKVFCHLAISLIKFCF